MVPASPPAMLPRRRASIVWPPFMRMRVVTENGKREAAAQRRPAKSERKTAVFPRNDRPYGLKCEAFQTENALERRQWLPSPVPHAPGSGLIIKSGFSVDRYTEKHNIPSCNENVSLCLPVCCARVLGKMGEFEGEPRERLSSLRSERPGPFCRKRRPDGRPRAVPVATREWASTAEQRGFFPLKKSNES